MAYAEPFNSLWMNYIYYKPRRVELSEKELSDLRLLRSMGVREASQKLADYSFNKYLI